MSAPSGTMHPKYEVVIGLEVHVQLATKSKVFSWSSTAFGAEPKAFEHRAIGEHEERGRFVVRPGGRVFRCCHERTS